MKAVKGPRQGTCPRRGTGPRRRCLLASRHRRTLHRRGPSCPAGKVALTGSICSGTDLRKLKEDLTSLERGLLPNRAGLVQDAGAKMDTIVGLLHDILERADALAGSPEQLNVLESAIATTSRLLWKHT